MHYYELIGSRCTAATIEQHVRRNWLPTQRFEVKHVAYHSFLISLSCDEDLENIIERKWDFLSSDIIVIRPWSEGDDTVEDAVSSVPQRAFIPTLARIMWSDDAIARACSILGQPLTTRALEQHKQNAPPTLEACVIIDANFKYLDSH